MIDLITFCVAERAWDKKWDIAKYIKVNGRSKFVEQLHIGSGQSELERMAKDFAKQALGTEAKRVEVFSESQLIYSNSVLEE